MSCSYVLFMNTAEILIPAQTYIAPYILTAFVVEALKLSYFDVEPFFIVLLQYSRKLNDWGIISLDMYGLGSLNLV